MYVPEKQYNPNASDMNDILERQRHEEEMEIAFIRMEKAKKRKQKAFWCSATGFIVGVLYIVYIALGIEAIDNFLGKLSGESGIIRFILDFLPPIILTGIISYIIARKEKGAVVYVFSAISVFLVVLLVFLVYTSLMMM